MFKYTLLVAAAAAQDPCACLESEENGLPPASFFEGTGNVGNYGSTCDTWDIELAYCQEGGEYFGEAWCTSPWCYVGSACEGSLETFLFNESEYAGQLDWSMDVCAATEEKSSMLYASAAVMLAALAASL